MDGEPPALEDFFCRSDLRLVGSRVPDKGDLRFKASHLYSPIL